MAMANLTVAYVLCFFFGIFGVHHFYLRRDRQAFVWWATLGGVLGLGWVRDFWQLSRYVEECNAEDPAYTRERNRNSQNDVHDRRREPEVIISKARYAGMIVMGLKFGTLAMMLCPADWFKRRDESGMFACLVLTPAAVALGVHLVANIGPLRAKLLWPLSGAFAGVYALWYNSYPMSLLPATILSTLSTSFSWKPLPRPRHGTCARLLTLVKYGTLYLLLWCAALYFNGTVTTASGREVPLRVVIHEFFQSPEWSEMKQALLELWKKFWKNFNNWLSSLFERKHEERFEEDRFQKENFKQDRFREEKRQQWDERTDPLKETDPYKILGVGRHASLTEIKTQYRKLVLIWHPDKHSDPALKEAAQMRFLKVQKAYDTLTDKRYRNSKQANKW